MYRLFGYFTPSSLKVGFVLPIFQKGDFLYKGVAKNGKYVEFSPIHVDKKDWAENHRIKKLPTNNVAQIVDKGDDAILVFKGKIDYFKGNIDTLRIALLENGVLDEVRSIHESNNTIASSNLYFDLLCFMGFAYAAYQFSLLERPIHIDANFVKYYRFDKWSYSLEDFLDYYNVSNELMECTLEDYIDVVGEYVFLGLHFFKAKDLEKAYGKIELLRKSRPEYFMILERILENLEYTKRFKCFSKDSPLAILQT